MENRVTNDQGMKEIEVCRKALLKAKQDELEDDILIREGIDLVLRSYPPAVQLKQLELLLALLRQLIHLCSSSHTSITSEVENKLIPAYQPGGHLASLILLHLDHSQKVQQQRSSEVLSLAGHLSTLLPRPSTSSSLSTTFIVPLFRQAINAGIARRSNLTVISTLLDYVPLSTIPSSLVGDLLGDLGIVDCANIRSNLIINLLTKLCSSTDEVLEKIVPYFDPSLPNAVMVTMNRYLLPALFKKDPNYVSALLRFLSDRADLFGAWITVASIGLSLGIVKIRDLPQDDLKDALAHEDADIRIRAFELVSGSKEQFSEDVMELIKDGFRWNDGLPSAGSRSAFSSSTFAFLVRLHQLETSTRRVLRKKPNTDSIKKEQESLSHVLPLGEDFHRWFLEYLNGGLIQARRFPVFKILLSLNLLGRYLDVFGDIEGVQEKVYTEERVEMLLACQMSEFTEVRNRSRKILKSAKIPLPGYESLSTPSSQALLNSGMNSINLPRKTQAEAGKSALCILFSKLVQSDEDQSHALRFVGDLISQLERGIEVVENDLVRGIEEYPLHGSLAAIGDLFSCLDLTTPNAQKAWQLTFHHLFTLINRIWSITKTVISLAPSTVEGAVDSSRPDHEIARAYEVLGNGDDEEEDGDGGEGMDHTVLLSGCWRATKSAGELLATIISLPITQSGTSQTIWTRAEIDTAGECFLTWMHEIKHRGTFSKIAIAFAQLVEAVRPIPELRGLCEDWLQHELRTIASDQHSTTRRSAALPYSILSLVSFDEELLNTALSALLDLARVENKQTSNVTKVHAFNVLKIVLLDAKQTKWFGQWFEKGVMTALGAFESADWNVRNVGLILFSTLVHRCLSPPRGGQDYYKSHSTLATRQSFSSFHSKYPLIIPFIAEYLEQHKSENTGNKHSPLFPILIIVRSLRYDDASEGLVEGLRGTVQGYLSSREYQVRQVAAQALSSLIPPNHSSDLALTLTKQMDRSDLNAVHGKALYLRQLIANVIPWSDIPDCSKQSIEDGLLTLVKRDVPGTCPPITQAILECVQDYRTNSKSISSELVIQTLSFTTRYLNTREDINFIPGEDARQISTVKFVLSHQPTLDVVLGLLSKSASEIDQTLVLESLPSLPQLWTRKVFDTILEIALSGRGGDGVRVLALDALSEIRWSDEIFRGMQGRWSGIIKRLERVIGGRCIPVREAGLVALGWAVKQSITCNDVQATQGLQVISPSILSFSQEDESQPSRYASLRSLAHLTPHLFSRPISILHQTLVRLIQDDDEEIRNGACEIVSQGLGMKRGVVLSKSLSLYWEWLEHHLKSLKQEEREEWLIWIGDLAKDEVGYKEDMRILGRHNNTTEVLFEVEPSNIFRDPLVDHYYSNRLLKSLHVGQDVRTVRPDFTEGSRLSPIDDAWEARRTMERRRASGL
ncbi:hypothetical protein I302_108871 [Kwoniella bestiolae CBS 10118]|uniref:Uncharacterized protein n=1 Tax=Kwoniella bestiolae CBS 10118 TaxID=1296100 RepID=A0A1B9FUB8_9TREE|nr:hypothetical protein I302_08008 [Kwoniella bestiolae CBS 10118]OCF22361.1 hypothetical protein I302_08008 [Kwoniella bestiolae CBS 10118]